MIDKVSTFAIKVFARVTGLIKSVSEGYNTSGNTSGSTKSMLNP